MIGDCLHILPSHWNEDTLPPLRYTADLQILPLDSQPTYKVKDIVLEIDKVCLIFDLKVLPWNSYLQTTEYLYRSHCRDSLAVFILFASFALSWFFLQVVHVTADFYTRSIKVGLFKYYSLDNRTEWNIWVSSIWAYTHIFRYIFNAPRPECYKELRTKSLCDWK